MGRLPALTTLLVVVSCNDPPKATGSGRSERVVASASATPSATAAPSDHAAVAPRGPLCDRSGELRTLPKSGAAFVDSTGGVTDRAMPAWDGKRVRWVSFFASWCGPCKEEFPRIKSFAQKLEQSGVPVDVMYLSIDDDLRQLTAFLQQQPDAGVKSAYWLKDGPPRTSWLASLKMKSDPALPEHAIFDGKGKLRCFISGAIEDRDYDALLASLR